MRETDHDGTTADDERGLRRHRDVIAAIVIGVVLVASAIALEYLAHPRTPTPS